jgi:two-component system, LytTR family, sensor kinase
MATSPFRSKQFMLPFCIGWFVWICVHHLALYYLGVGWFTALADSIVSNTLLIFVAMLLLTILRFYLPRKSGFLNLFLWVTVLTTGWFFANSYLLGLIINNENYLQLQQQLWPVRAAVGFLVNGISSVIGYAYFNWQEKTETEKQKTEAVQLSKEAELYKLRQQLQPHFLFNSLNSINALIGSSPAQARTMLHQLSDFLRNTLRKEEEQWINLKEELNTLNLYLEIEKVRFGNRLAAIISVDENCSDAKIPAMLLQPLVENAIKFGLYDTVEQVTIQLLAAMNKQQLEITVTNPFDATTSNPQKGTGFGLSSVQRRLYLLFGRNDLLHTSTNENTFVTKVIVPQTTSFFNY